MHRQPGGGVPDALLNRLATEWHYFKNEGSGAPIVRFDKSFIDFMRPKR